MVTRNIFKYLALTTLALISTTASASAIYLGQEGKMMSCDDRWYDGRGSTHCEIREQSISAPGGTLIVNGGKNGGISIKGWDQEHVLIRTKIQTHGKSLAEAREVAGQIQVIATGGNIRAEGPKDRDSYSWSSSYEIFVPRQADLSLETFNGGISLTDVRGRIEFKALNGGISIKRVGGSVRGHTTNGGLSVMLDGTTWEGEGLDVSTTNGGVNIVVPENYSARLESGTVHGGMTLGFPVMVQGRINKEISVDLGGGGPTVRAVTTNGGVTIRRQGQN
ncbi:MAG TPA: hypothetical protein VJQ56_15070 [Blastocatellia bacterium]|nr:hypothetical protein [Blastocatellia bacterium]